MSRNYPLKQTAAVATARAFLLLILFTVFYTTVNAQYDGGVQDNYNGTAIGLAANNLTANELKDFSSIVPFSTDASATTICPEGNSAEITASRKIINIIRLALNEETVKYLPADFTFTVNIKIEYGHDASSLNTIASQPFTVNYNKAEGTKYSAKNYFSFEGAEYVKVTILDFDPSTTGDVNMSDIIYVENEMRVTRYYELQPEISPVSFSGPSAVENPVDNVSISWSWPADAGNNGTQLEWTWLEDELEQTYFVDGSLNYDLLFQDNATRIDLPYNTNSYNIPLFYDGPGKMYYRIRPVNYKADGSRTDGAWTVPSTEGAGICSYDGHNNFLNWQVKSSFAEEGKMKSVMSYFDGSLRSRQTVTKENVNNTTITAETLYDYEGRPAINILPAPSINNIIAYTTNLNMFNGQAAGQNSAELFDLQDIVDPVTTIPQLDIAYGASNYYSPQNPDIDGGANKNIPDAEGFPFTATRYTPDGTGRVMAQSGVGPAFQMGSDRETKYYYGNPSQEELDGLFGTDVGNYTHYFKNMVKDANGQMSVNYVDMHGRTIATALAGTLPDNSGLLPLNNNDGDQYPNQGDENSIIRNLLDQSTNIEKENTIESVISLLVPDHNLYKFKYKLSPESLEMQTCNSTPVCYDCLYDLEITITDETGVQPIYKYTYTNLSVDGNVDDDCNTTNAFVKTCDECDDVINNQIEIDKELDPGSYSIRKTLKVSESSLQKYKDLFLQQGNGICETEQDFIDAAYSELLATSNCNTPSEVPDCQRCLDELGDYTTYRGNYLVSIDVAEENVTPQLEAEIQRQFNDRIAKCNSICNTSGTTSPLLLSKRQMMLADMMPYGGQYALNEAPPSLVSGASTNMFDKYNIFSTAFDGDSRTANFRKPKIDNGDDIVDGFYRDNLGNIDQQIQPDNSYALLQDDSNPDYVDNDHFASQFQNSWAEALISYHPEYPRLKYVEANLANGSVNIYNWMSSFNATDDYTTAQANGYIITDATISNDPFYTIATDKVTAMNGLLYDNYDNNNHGIWQLARVQVKCKNIFDNNDRLQCYSDFQVVDQNDPLDDITNPAEKDEIWRAFRNLYSSARESEVNNYVAEMVPLDDGDELVNEGYKLWFGTNKQTAAQSHFDNYPDEVGAPPTGVDALTGVTNNNNSGTTAYQQSQCSSYISYWKNKLLQCEALAGSPDRDLILEEITTGMVAVCNKGIDAANPYGSSTVNPASPFDDTPRSFEEVINTVFTNHSIDMQHSYFCNPFVIDYPKPYGKGPKYADEQTSLVTECACNNFSAMLTDLPEGYDPESLSSVNGWLQSKSLEPLTEVIFEALLNCSTYQHEVCSPTSITKTVSCYDPNPCTEVCGIASRSEGSSGPTDQNSWDQLISCFFDNYEMESLLPANTNPNCDSNFVNFFNNYYGYTGIDRWNWSELQTGYQSVTGQTLNVCNSCTTTVSCEVESECHSEFLPFILSSPQPLPGYLKCGGWPAETKCLTCGGLADLTSEFKSLFAEPYNSAPVFNTNNLTPEQVQQNILYSNFLNFRTGLQLGWMQYAQAAAQTNCSADGTEPSTVVDLSVSSRNGNVPTQYIASKSITFNAGFESGTDDIFETLISENGGGDGNITIVCHDTRPVNDGTGIFIPEEPCEWVHTQAVALGHKRYMDMLQDQEALFEGQYRARCMAAKDLETFTVGYINKEYHYTLYYYDVTGSLIMTVPPKGVRPDFSEEELLAVKTARANDESRPREHELQTNYRYNSIGQPILNNSPDAYLTQFWYDRIGRLSIAQNAQQQQDNNYSYTMYDELGRVSEVGQRPGSEAMTPDISESDEALNNWILNDAEGVREQITKTGYDAPYLEDNDNPGGLFTGLGLEQKNLRNKVSYTVFKNSASDETDYTTGTFYTYDEHGNIDVLLQDYSGVPDMQSTDNSYKRIRYNYDLISGKVNMVSYQPDYISSSGPVTNNDKFFHQYKYDAENRLTEVWTSRDKIEWERDAAYSYFKHGPLSRTVLGHLQVQGVDYAYTLQGWMKGVNSTAVGDGRFDIGKDGLIDDEGAGTIASSNSKIARDIFGFGLHYFDNGDGENDYKAISGSSLFSSPNNGSFRSLYNGNIAGMSVNNAGLLRSNSEGTNSSPLFYNYRYDQLNRIKSLDAYIGLDNLTNHWNPESISDYGETVDYDPSGNIINYIRKGAPSTGSPEQMDELGYEYIPGTNKLRHISDNVDAVNYDNDLDNQDNPDNYTYDQIGNLKSDAQGGINNINWTVYGKIASIEKGEETIYYTYDASGNRITKTANGKTTIYVRDASGNVMSVYEREPEDAIQQTEVNLYGSGRIGMATQLTVPVYSQDLEGGFNLATISTFTRGEKLFELNNHLGNVLVTITDRKVQNSDDNTNVNYYTADVRSAQDYYPGGMFMPGRKFINGSYRYGFNGKEMDNEINGEGNQYDYGFRIYNPQISRFLSVDPLSSNYPELTPYQFSGNNPIRFIDLDGLECAAKLADGTLFLPSGSDRLGFKYPQGAKLVDVPYGAQGVDETCKFFSNQVFPRVGGLLRTAAGGVIMFVGGASSEFMVGVPVFLYGLDQGSAGLRQLWYGGEQKSYTQQSLEYIGVPENDAKTIDNSATMLLSLSPLTKTVPASNSLLTRTNVYAENLSSIRQALGNSVGKTRNIAYVEGTVSGEKVFGAAVSGEAMRAGTGLVEMPLVQSFTTFTVKHSRAFDSEVKLLENLATKLNKGSAEANQKIFGDIKIVSELPVCPSCSGVMDQFKAMFPNIKISYVDGNQATLPIVK